MIMVSEVCKNHFTGYHSERLKNTFFYTHQLGCHGLGGVMPVMKHKLYKFMCISVLKIQSLSVGFLKIRAIGFFLQSFTNSHLVISLQRT